MLECSEEDERDSGYILSLKVNPSTRNRTMINFIKIDFDDQSKQESYDQILRYNDYENLIKLFHKETSSVISEEINLDQSLVLFDLIYLIFTFDNEGSLTSEQRVARELEAALAEVLDVQPQVPAEQVPLQEEPGTRPVAAAQPVHVL